MSVRRFSQSGESYDSLSFLDLLVARDTYHVHLMSYPHVVATALGRYRIRSRDSWPKPDGTVKRRGRYARTLRNSEVRAYSWPSILVFVDEWVDVSAFGKGGSYDPNQMVPRTLFLANGKRVPVCVVLVEKVLQTPPTPDVTFPLNNIGGGYPIIADVQGREHVATISCLVTDGHRTYALTNRHVAGDPGEILYSELNGRRMPIGRSSSKQLTRLPFAEVYEGMPGRDVFLNLDVGLIDIDNLNSWSSKVRTVGTVGQLADLPPTTMSLSLIGCEVTGVGAASKRMNGEISALLYRYKSVGGFEYLADFLIGPRNGATGSRKRQPDGLMTHPGDSGTLWLFEPAMAPSRAPKRSPKPTVYHPFGVQWGAQVFEDTGASSFALATSLSTICNLLDVDLVRDWNLDEPDTWGAVGHFSIALSTARCLTNTRLKDLMTKHADLISPDRDTILSSDFKGMGSEDFVHLADVPDMFWKPRVAKQGFTRPMEGPNHFADMDQVRESDGETLLRLTQKDDFIDPDKWNAFYDSVNDILSGDPIQPVHRGLVPFRVWQIFDEMVAFAKAKKVPEFVCAAGVLTHYVGDACQPLHISFLHDGDPAQPQTKTVHHKKDNSDEEVTFALGAGVHSAYEDGMVNAHREKILDALQGSDKVVKSEMIANGFEAAKATIQMMRTVFKRVPPKQIVQLFIDSDAKPKQMAEDMWDAFGTGTLKCMQDGVHLLAIFWQSAWIAGGGDQIPASALAKPITPNQAMKICQKDTFLPSLPIGRIGKVLKRP